jgi:hypothetical protein
MVLARPKSFELLTQIDGAAIAASEPDRIVSSCRRRKSRRNKSAPRSLARVVRTREDAE